MMYIILHSNNQADTAIFFFYINSVSALTSCKINTY
jgi:hypothetical protein